MERTIEFDDEDQIVRVCGINDRNLPYLETLLGCDLHVRGNRLTYIGKDGQPAMLFSSLLSRLRQLADRQVNLSEAEIFMEYQSLKTLPPAFEAEDGKGHPFICVQNRFAYPKGPHQQQYIEAMETSQIVFGVGPAGTGKTFLAVTYALSLLLNGKKQKIILTRPIVEAGESLGFLPGDLAQKINPYLRPLYDAMEITVKMENIRRLEDSGAIEIAPLAYMRGRSLQNAVVILDEAQNTSREQMKMFLTRLGENATAIVTGDVSQIDLPRRRESGLVHALQILDGLEGLSIVRFDSRDVVRSRIVQRIVDAYDADQCDERKGFIS